MYSCKMAYLLLPDQFSGADPGPGKAVKYLSLLYAGENDLLFSNYLIKMDVICSHAYCYFLQSTICVQNWECRCTVWRVSVPALLPYFNQMFYGVIFKLRKRGQSESREDTP
jgi:hypothetical protein